MFHSSIPAPLRSIICEHAGTWPGKDIYVDIVGRGHVPAGCQLLVGKPVSGLEEPGQVLGTE